jgi:predicted transcriptional regulator
MTKEELVSALQFQIADLKETVLQAEAVRSFVDQNLLSEAQAVEDQLALLNQIIYKSAAIDDLINDFLKSSQLDNDLADAAKQILSAAQEQIAKF